MNLFLGGWEKAQRANDLYASGLRYTSIWNSAAIQTSDVASAIQANLAKKDGKYSKL
jgi:hypothetical protein